MKKLRKFYNLIEALEKLPAIGKKSATRLAFYMVLENSYDALKIAHAIEEAVTDIKKCSICGGLSEDEICHICLDEYRDKDKLCLVESAKDIYLIEESKEYDGYYFVFDKLSDENIEKLKEIVDSFQTKEVIFAFTPSIQSDALMLFIEDRLSKFDISFSKIAQGVPTGVKLENIDTLSLSKAISERVKA
jgi:recombination protein RecR